MIRWFLISLMLTAAIASVMAFVGFCRTDLFMEKIPTHWNLHMEPDAWTTPDRFVWDLLLFPGIMILMLLLMMVLPAISPKNFKIERFADTFGFVMTSLVAFFGWLGCLVLWRGLEENPYWSRCFIASFFALFAVLGNVMGKVKRNFWMGIRTPWTLASEPVWDRTHRLAAWLWVGAGLGGSVLVLLGAPFWISLILIVAATLWPLVYSLVLYKALERQGKV